MTVKCKKKSERKKRKIIKSVQETKKNVVSNLFFHEFIGDNSSVTAAGWSVKSQVVYFVNLNSHSKQLKIKE